MCIHACRCLPKYESLIFVIAEKIAQQWKSTVAINQFYTVTDTCELAIKYKSICININIFATPSSCRTYKHVLGVVSLWVHMFFLDPRKVSEQQIL